MLELGVIADDLTGGMMVASLLEREGVRCPLVTSGDALNTLDDDAQAVVVGRKLLIQPLTMPVLMQNARLKLCSPKVRNRYTTNTVRSFHLQNVAISGLWQKR